MLEKNDRIIEINGIRLIVHDNIRTNRRNVICTSKKLERYLQQHNVNKEDFNDICRIGRIISDNNNMFDYIQIVKVDGYY